MSDPKAPRNLTDADIDALVARFNDRFEKTFYQNVGKGVTRLAWVGVIACILGLAYFGHFGGGK